MISIRQIGPAETPNAVCSHCLRRGAVEAARVEAIDGHIRAFLCPFHEGRARNRQFLEALAIAGNAMLRGATSDARRILTAARWGAKDIDAVLAP